MHGTTTEKHPPKPTVSRTAFAAKALVLGSRYFFPVLTAGFALGVLRTLWLEPWVGTQAAKLFELPFMWLLIGGVAVWALRGDRLAPPLQWLRAGLVALLLMLLSELLLAWWLQGADPVVWLRAQHSPAGWLYGLSLLYFALLPAVLRRCGVA